MSAAGPFTPIKDFVTLLPHLGYQIYFSERTREAIAELNADIRRSLRSVYRSVSDPPPNEFLLSTTSLLEAYGTNQEVSEAQIRAINCSLIYIWGEIKRSIISHTCLQRKRIISSNSILYRALKIVSP